MVFLTPADSKFVESVFRRYYRNNAETVLIPERIAEREFGYFTFEGETMIRHLYIESKEKLIEFLKKNTPLHVYHSAAFYTYPSAPMEEKGWLGAELVFDIDADHLNTLCKREHDFKVCSRCFTPYPKQLSRCDKCGNTLIDVEWVCNLCLEAAREEVEKLLDFLEGDLGFRKIRIAFSGNRGYHLAVVDEHVIGLGQQERKEIVDYVTGMGLSLRSMGLIEDPKRDKIAKGGGPDITDLGWRKRIARSIIYLVLKADEKELTELSGDPQLTKKYINLIKQYSEEWSERPAWDTLPRGLIKLLGKAATAHASAKIDVVVTSDIHRLIRLGNTLNGKSGLLAKTINLDELDEFNPFAQAVALPIDEEVEVYVLRSPKFNLGGREFGPYENLKVNMPLAAAILLIAKNAATISR
ncbi:MAG: DNA primase small subunit PriS [Aigarchaeota archaeon]|nr:DNA primase small subunit PriS [Aigarchaeota archaeon]MDW7985631.1 DNA primase small subunit PriS [Nitrososphaerota archaeon]